MSQMLKGIRVLDCTRLIPGPFATHLLSELGADVLKVEQPRVGDYCRELDPQIDGMWTVFHSLNKNKKSITLDCKHTKGKEIFLNLVQQSDVVVESFRPEVMKKLELDYDHCKKHNDSIIYVSLTGWGQNGPYSKMAGHDINYLSIAGLIGLSTSSNGEPAILGTQIADYIGGYIAVIAILGALYQRSKCGGQGCYLDVAMLDGVLAIEQIPILNTLLTRNSVKPRDDMLLGKYVCYNLYQTSDGRYMSLGCSESKFWERFCYAVNRPDWVKSQFALANNRGIHADIKKTFLTKTLKEWTLLGEATDCCLFPVLQIDEVIQHKQINARNMVSHTQKLFINHPISPTTLTKERDSNAPTIGRDTRSVLSKLGYSEKEIDDLFKEGII